MLNAYNLGGMASAKEVIEFLRGARYLETNKHLQLDRVIDSLEESHSAYMNTKGYDMPENVRKLIREGQKIQAIKELYSVWSKDFSLVDCKDVCDAYEKGYQRANKTRLVAMAGSESLDDIRGDTAPDVQY